jgi:hypothetical protein
MGMQAKHGTSDARFKKYVGVTPSDYRRMFRAH